MDHDIFRTPHPVTPTLEERETPPGYRGRPGAEALGETMPMWRVQTEGYKDGTSQLIGVVSRDAGFFDSPDVEWISGGVNTKGPNAVAVGRHGNFFHWGFAASPTYLTDEAKLVLVNALHYIARFDRQPPVARKIQGCPPRVAVEQAIESITDEGYARTVEMYAAYREDMPDIETPERLARVRSYLSPEKIAELGEDPAAIGAYLREVLPYMRSDGGWYTLVVDEELRELGVANDDPALLDRAIGLLEDGTDAERARALLERYTTESFATAAEWRGWLDANRERLFFTEVGGYRWLVDRPAGAPAAPVLASAPRPEAAPELAPTNAEPLVAEATVKDLGGGRHELTVHVAVLPGWHAYDQIPPGVPYRALTLELDLPDGLRRDGDWVRPSSHPDPGTAGLTLFEGRLAFRCTLVEEAGFASPAEVSCALGFQVCNERMCHRPTTQTLTASIED